MGGTAIAVIGAQCRRSRLGIYERSTNLSAYADVELFYAPIMVLRCLRTR